MKGFYRALFTLGLLIAAVIFYIIGGAFGLLAMVVIGAGFELAFWAQLLKQRSQV
ncbi:MAG: hypothetical protein ACI8WB_004195 [Phenylobacterium sp.]|jgi:hypothetical protein